VERRSTYKRNQDEDFACPSPPGYGRAKGNPCGTIIAKRVSNCNALLTKGFDCEDSGDGYEFRLCQKGSLFAQESERSSDDGETIVEMEDDEQEQGF
jgi:hypothetical protein